MAIRPRSEMKDRKPEIDLSGPDGNAYALMGHARNFAKQLNIDPEPIITDMMSSNYEHLLEVFEKHFGEYVTLYRDTGDDE
jgi:hypothetical protein